MFSIKDKVSIVTGGNGGIGEGIAKGFADSGSIVAIVGRNDEKSKKVKDDIVESGGKAEYFSCDVSKYESVKSCIEEVNSKLGSVDILVNNAGIGIRTKEPQ